MPLMLRVPLLSPAIRPKSRKQMVQRKEYESLYSSLLSAEDPTNARKLNKAIEKAEEYGRYACTDDSY